MDNTKDVLISSNNGWVLVPISTNTSMVIYNNDKRNLVKFRLGNSSTSTGIDLVYNKPITVDTDVYIMVKSGFNNIENKSIITVIETTIV